MSFVEDLISRAFLSKEAQVTMSKGILQENEVEETPPTPTPVVTESVYSGRERKMNFGYLVYGQATTMIKVSTIVNGQYNETKIAKNPNVEVKTANSQIKTVSPLIQVEVGNINV